MKNTMKKNHLRYQITLVFVLLNFLILNAQTVKNFNIDLTRKLNTISPLFWGTNFLFWIDDKASLQDGLIETSLKNMPCTILRYPGGTVAENFHWKTTMLDNAFIFPFQQGASQTNFDEFIAFCRRVNAEPLLVVNTQSWWIHNDVAGGVKEAVDWVQYCKDKNYNVKYWEIGNETYWQQFMTATEYGQLVKKYARAMKAVDPTIKISANGAYDPNFVGSKERTTVAVWDSIRLKYLNINSYAQSTEFDAYARSYKTLNITTGTEKWWNNVANACGDSIDMISVHWYYRKSDISVITSNLNSIKAVFNTKFPGRKYTMCLTEYNSKDDSADLAVANLFDGIGQFLNFGFEIGNFWPLRFDSGLFANRSMLSLTAKEESYPYQILKLLSNNLKGEMIYVNSDSSIFPYVSYDGSQLTVVVCSRSITTAVNAVMNLQRLSAFRLVDAKAYDAPLISTPPIQLVESNVNVVKSNTTCTFQLLPKQTVVLRFNNIVTNTSDVKTADKIVCNYANGKINFRTDDTVDVTLSNMNGQILCVKKASGLISLDAPSKGLYILKIDSDKNGSQVQKILVNE